MALSDWIWFNRPTTGRPAPAGAGQVSSTRSRYPSRAYDATLAGYPSTHAALKSPLCTENRCGASHAALGEVNTREDARWSISTIQTGT